MLTAEKVSATYDLHVNVYRLRVSTIKREFHYVANFWNSTVICPGAESKT